MSAILLGVDNDRATLTKPCEPWLFQANTPPELIGDKPKWLVWRALPSTEHLLYTPGVGINPNIRANSKTNVIRKLSALVADYDSLVSEVIEDHALKNMRSDLKPTWMSTTFSGGRRLVWIFESSIVFDAVLAKNFYHIAARETLWEKIFSGPDRNGWSDPYRIFDVGHSWRQLSDKPIPTNVLHLWLTEAAKGVDWTKLGEIVIPLEEVEAEVHRQFPGQWSGSFSEGARGPVFWDGGGNPSSCILRTNGVTCFSREKLFFSWSEILGAAFVRKFQADRVGAAVTSTWWDGRNYFCKDDAQWWTHTTETVKRAMKVDHGLDDGKGRGETCSEVDRALRFVEKHRRVAGAVPIVFNPDDIVHINGQKFLNTSHVKPMQPADERQEWAVNFAWIAAFLEARFLSNERPYLLAWFQRAYVGALSGNPMRCQALFLVGGVNLGKTLFSNKIVGGALGGFADASSHIAKGSEFNKELGETGLLCIDDGEVATDAEAHRRWTESVKKVVSNPVFTWRAMRRDPQTIPLNAKLIATLNDDSFSVQMIPDLALSVEEKIMVLRFHDDPFSFQPNHVQEPVIESELPFFLRWLVDWSPPPEVIGDSRLGVKSFINEDLRAKALHSGGVGDLLELVGIFLKSIPPEDGDWIGTASDFYSQATRWDDTKMLVSKYSPRVIGRRFSEASRIRDSGISLADENKKRGNSYRISNPERTDGKPVRVTPEVAG